MRRTRRWLVVSSLALELSSMHHAAARQSGTTDDASAVIAFEDVYYPRAAREAGVQGAVVVVVELNGKGEVVEASAESGPRLLIPAALESVKRWKFEPGAPKGVVVYDFAIEACRSESDGLFRVFPPNLARITACAPGNSPSTPVVDEAPAVLEAPEIRYPAVASSAKISGAVVIAVEINSTGDVIAASALAGPASLRPDAMANALRWKFKPGSGEKATIVYDFRVEGICHDVRGSLFTRRHANVASIVKCGTLPMPDRP